MGLRELQYLNPRLNSSPETPGFRDRIKNKRLGIQEVKTINGLVSSLV